MMMIMIPLNNLNQIIPHHKNQRGFSKKCETQIMLIIMMKLIHSESS
jgi:hypothetical protein